MAATASAACAVQRPSCTGGGEQAHERDKVVAEPGQPRSESASTRMRASAQTAMVEVEVTFAGIDGEAPTWKGRFSSSQPLRVAAAAWCGACGYEFCEIIFFDMDGEPTTLKVPVGEHESEMMAVPVECLSEFDVDGVLGDDVDRMCDSEDEYEGEHEDEGEEEYEEEESGSSGAESFKFNPWAPEFVPGTSVSDSSSEPETELSQLEAPQDVGIKGWVVVWCLSCVFTAFGAFLTVVAFLRGSMPTKGVDEAESVPVTKQRHAPMEQTVREIDEVPKAQYIDNVQRVPVTKQQQVPMVQTVQETAEVPQVQHIDKVKRVPATQQRQVSMEQTVQEKVEVPRAKDSDKVQDVLVTNQRQVPMVQTVQETVDVPQAQHIDKVKRVPETQHRQVPMAQTVRETVEVPQVQYIDKVQNVPVPKQRQVPMVRTVQKSVEVPQVQYIDKANDVPVAKQRRVPMVQTVQKTVVAPQVQDIIDEMIKRKDMTLRNVRMRHVLERFEHAVIPGLDRGK